MCGLLRVASRRSPTMPGSAICPISTESSVGSTTRLHRTSGIAPSETGRTDSGNKQAPILPQLARLRSPNRTPKRPMLGVDQTYGADHQRTQRRLLRGLRSLLDRTGLAGPRQRHHNRIIRVQAAILGICSWVRSSRCDALNLIGLAPRGELNTVSAFLAC